MTDVTARLMLVLAAAFWGFGNIPQKLVLEHVDPFAAVVGRCVIAALVLLPFALREFRGRAAPGWTTSVLRVTLLLAGAITTQQMAYETTTVTNGSFLVNICTVIAPVAAFLLYRERPGAVVAVAAPVTLAGAFLMTGGGLEPLRPGDLLALLCGVIYAVWIVEAGRHIVQHGRPFATTFLQFAGTAVIALPFGLPGLTDGAAVRAALPDLLLLGLITTAAPYCLQAFAQARVRPGAAAVLMSAEAVFGAMGAILILGERPPILTFIGMALILGAILAVARNPGPGMDQSPALHPQTEGRPS